MSIMQRHTGNEVDFVLCCPVLDDIRKKFILIKFCKQSCFFRLNLLLASSYQDIVIKLNFSGLGFQN